MTYAQKSIFMTFYPGMMTNHSLLCGGELSFDANNKEKSRISISIPSPNYACEFRIKVKSLRYRNSGSIFVWLEQSNNTNVFVYSGNGHNNLTTLIEGGNTAAVGAPYSV